MDRSKIYCMGCQELPKVLLEIEQKGIACIEVGLHQALEENNAIAFSVTSNHTFLPHIGWCSREDFYQDHGYKKVSVEKFREAWLGTKKVIGYSGCPELKKLVDKLEKEFVFTRKHIGTNNCHFTFIKKEDGTYSFEYIDSDLVLPDVNLSRFENFWRKELPKKTVVPEKKYVGFVGCPEAERCALPLGLDHSFVVHKNFKNPEEVFYLDENKKLCFVWDKKEMLKHIKIVTWFEFVLHCYRVLGVYIDPELGKVDIVKTEFERLQKIASIKPSCDTLAIPILDHLMILKPNEVPEETSLSLPPKKSLKIVL